MHAYPCLVRAKADVAIALEQIYDYISASPLLPTLRPAFHARMLYLVGERIKKRDALNALEEKSTDNILTAPYIIGSLRRHCPSDFLVLNEAISNYAHVWNHMVPVFPGSVLSSGASSLGWALGAAIGAKLAGDAWPEHRKELIACVVGDGSFLFGVPSTAYWMARRYDAVSTVPSPLSRRLTHPSTCSHSSPSYSTMAAGNRPN
jgi:acetolactate synthase-1/2/3 large subunit